MSEQHESQIFPWQNQVWETLTQRFPQIGHGLLFYGKNGSGKQQFTQHFVAWLLCLNKQSHAACGECSSCLWLKSDTHPNYVRITTDEDNKKQNAKIKIEKIRDLQPFVQQTVDGWRVIVIEPAEALNIASSNALLKTLEEPGDRVIIILLADHYLKLPATIRSRLQHYALDRVSLGQSQIYLESHLDKEFHSKIPLLMSLSNDMALQAVVVSQSEWFKKRYDFLADWQKVVMQKSMPMQHATKWNKELAFADLITLFEYLLSDIICVKLNQNVKNSDLDFEQISQQYSLEQLFDLNSDIQNFKQLVEQNVQSNLVVDQLFIKLMNIA